MLNPIQLMITMRSNCHLPYELRFNRWWLGFQFFFGKRQFLEYTCNFERLKSRDLFELFTFEN